MKWLVAVVLLMAQAAPAISVSPGSGPPGADIRVVGSDFASGERVKVLWDGANLGRNGEGRIRWPLHLHDCSPRRSCARLAFDRSRRGGRRWSRQGEDHLRSGRRDDHHPNDFSADNDADNDADDDAHNDAHNRWQDRLGDWR